MTDTRQIFANNLSRLVEERGIEQQKLAFDLGVSPSNVSSWILGKRFPRADMMQNIAEYFHVTVADLVEPSHDQPLNPKLAVLFSRSRKLTDKQLDIINTLVSEMTDEQNGNS